MKNLLIPAAGKSSRFPNMRPKWMLTHPNGNMMFVESISGLDLSEFENIERFPLFNTNNIWINLNAAYQVLKENQQKDIPFIINQKTETKN